MEDGQGPAGHCKSFSEVYSPRMLESTPETYTRPVGGESTPSVYRGLNSMNDDVILR